VKQRKTQGSLPTHTHQEGSFDLLSRTGPTESFVIWKMVMGPISYSSQDLRSSPNAEQNQKPHPAQQFRGKWKGWKKQQYINPSKSINVAGLIVTG